MMNMMMRGKNPDDVTKMMGEMMPQMVGKMGSEEIERMMLDMMPRMMDTRFAEMARERRQFMLTHCRGMPNQMDEKYLRPAAT